MKMNRYFLGLFLILLVAGIAFFILKPSELVGDIDIKYPMQIVTADMKHERTFTWQSDRAEKASIEYHLKGDKNNITVKAESQELPSYKGNHRMIHSAHLVGLKAGSDYEYRIIMGNKKSEWKLFKTEPENLTDFKVLIFGDSQAADYNIWQKTAETAWTNNKDASFFINMGDIVDNGQDDWQWGAWANGVESFLDKIPFSPIMGNHEAYSLDWKMAEPKTYLALFPVPNNGPQGLDRFAYSYDYGDIHFAVINTQLMELKEWYPDLLKKQKEWLAADLAKTDKKWKIVLMHRGNWKRPYTGTLDEIGETFVPVFDQYHVDLVFTAHIHSYARTGPLIGGNTTDPKGTVYITTGRSGDRTWNGSPRKPMDEAFYNPTDMPNYLTLESTSNSLRITAFKQNGNTIDQTEIKK